MPSPIAFRNRLSTRHRSQVIRIGGGLVRGRRKFLPDLERFEDRTLLSNVSWINAVGGDWDTASNWSTGQVPGVLHVVTINKSPGITVTHSLGNADSVKSLTVAAADTLTLSAGSLDFAAASTISGPFNLAGGTLTGTGR